MNLLEKTWEEYESKKEQPILITYNDSKLNIFSDLEEKEPQFLKENYGVIKYVMEKAIARGHFYSANLKSISNNFKISLEEDSFFVEFSSNILDHLNKWMVLGYRYDQVKEKWKVKTLSTKMGRFYLKTNVSGVYRLLNKPFDIQHSPGKKQNSTLRFLQNLQVNQKEIPSFLQIPGTPEKALQKCKK